MALKTARLTIDRNLLPQKWDDLGIRFESHSVAKIKAGSPPADMVLVKPAGSLLGEADSVGPEPRWNNILCGMRLNAKDGTNIQGRGQFIITAQRFIGMIDSEIKSGGSASVQATSNSVFCFACRRDDVYSPEMKRHRLTPSDFLFRSKEEQPIAFGLVVFMGMAYVANQKMGYWHDKNMLRALSEEGRQGLLES